MVQLVNNSPDFFYKISNWFTHNRTAILIAVIAALIAGIILLIITQIISHRKQKKEKDTKKTEEDNNTQAWRKKKTGALPDDFYGYYPKENYIQPYFTFIDKEKGKRGKQLLRDYFLNKVFVEETKEPRIFCLLGDTGTGKTAALVNLFADYINSHTENDLPYPIEILSMRQKDVFENIRGCLNFTQKLY